MSCWRCDGAIVVAPYWLGYGAMVRGILDDYGLDSRDHPEMALELDQAIGEAIIDTTLGVLQDHTADPRVAAALQRARGEAA